MRTFTFDATKAALEHFDRVDEPALHAAYDKGPRATDHAGLVESHRIAADKVRAAFLRDTADVNTPENVDLMSVDTIRDTVRGTLAGRLLRLLP